MQEKHAMSEARARERDVVPTRVDTDVLVVGASPAGAAMALALSTLGVDHVVTTRYASLAAEPRPAALLRQRPAGSGRARAGQPVTDVRHAAEPDGAAADQGSRPEGFAAALPDRVPRARRGRRRCHPDSEGRHLALYGPWLAGATPGVTTMGLHHKLCHSLGGTLNLLHVDTHTVVLPYVLAFNTPALDADTLAVLTDVLGSGRDQSQPADTLRGLGADLGARMSLSALGADRAALRDIAAQAADSPYSNPRTASEAEIAALLDLAWLGAPPETDPV